MVHADVIRYREQRRKDQNGRCYYCHLRLLDDCTAEHLKAKHHGGPDVFANIRASHSKCNVLVGTLSVKEKVRLHKLGLEEGSDAFFREVQRVNPLKSRKKVLPKHSVGASPRVNSRATETKAEAFARIAAQSHRAAARLGISGPAGEEEFKTADTHQDPSCHRPAAKVIPT
ncbi:HNH endonuclease [Sphingomonas sp. 3-13AW]|uniref:HNH endonuclease n=1 Tax=Sphingomonas sp. 3-13AW TaxID=3050450 RepID=UPI003BB78210